MTFVAGYLGAGKTTLINAFLARADRPVAVFVNDVGEINIDAKLIRKRSGDTIELTDGCVCCSISQGFGFALDQIREREVPPDHLVVELSGVAVPNQVLPWALSAGFMLDGVVTAVDVEQLAERMKNPVSAHTISAQLADADLVVLTKGEGAGPERRAEAMSIISELAPRTPTHNADTASLLLQLGGRRPGGPTATPTSTLFDSHEVSKQPLPVASEERLLQVLQKLPSSAVRAKGIGADPDGALWLLQRVGARCSVTLLPEAEAHDPTDLVVISLPDHPH